MSDVVDRLNAALGGRYTIERELGEGGMATVYLADDLKHERRVALKVLKPELAAVVGAERFLAEIKTTANLTHPHILPLFDSGEADSFLFYVMPHIEGESLRERIDREKQLGVDDSVAITQKVAGALDYAHQNGVVHRDIKPGNILLSAQGEPLVADFGIALAVAQAGAGRITETGLSLGTPHYMSPEQATGDRDVDPRSDVYALGCVLYEMLSGQPPFSASSAQAVLVKILTADAPSITSERRTVSPHVGQALAKSLEKLPADRFTSAAALADPSFTYEARARTSVGTPTPEAVAPSPQTTGIDRRAFAGVTVVAVAALSLLAWGWLQPGPEPAHATRSIIDLGDIVLSQRDEIIVSPDGSRFAVVGAVDGQTALYWRDAAEENFRVIPGTENAGQGAAFSPDGDWIVYVTTQDALLKVSLLGGAPTPVAPPGEVTPLEPHWGDDGTIVFTGQAGLHRVPDTGGVPELILGPEQRFGAPSLLPGGGAVIGARSGGGIMLLDLETDSVRELVPGGFDPKYVETGHILYVDTSGGLWALPFDANRGSVLGAPVPILEGVSIFPAPPGRRFSRFSISRNGTLVYGAGGAGFGSDQRRLLVVDLEGGDVEEPPLDPRRFFGHRWSRDGRFVAYASVEAGDQDPDIFTYDVNLGTTPRPLTFEGINVQPVWSPDGDRIAFRSQREGTQGFDLFVKNVNDNSPPDAILTLPGNQAPTHWPSDDVLIFESGTPPDLWFVDLSSDSAVAREYLPSEAALQDMRVSPSDDLAAYVSNDSGTDEVYVRSFPEPGAREAVSQGGGRYPFWSPDGNTIYYWTVGPQGSVITFMAARVQRGPPFVVTVRESILEGPYRDDSWALHPDGERIVVVQDVTAASVEAQTDGTTSPERFLVVTNWFEELRERLGEN